MWEFKLKGTICHVRAFFQENATKKKKKIYVATTHAWEFVLKGPLTHENLCLDFVLQALKLSSKGVYLRFGFTELYRVSFENNHFSEF